MGDLIKLTSISYEKPMHDMKNIYIVKDKILVMKRIKDAYTSITMTTAYLAKVKELPEDINKDLNLLKFTSYENGEPVYIARDAIVGFLEEPEAIYINLIRPSFHHGFKGITVKETLEEIKKIIEGK